jgi:hypothetical protein
MALSGKEKVINPTPSTIIIRTSVIITDLTANIFKASTPEIVKPEPFHGLR